MKEDYLKLLGSPEWADRRKDILKRDRFTCQRCGSSYNQLIETKTVSKPADVFENYSSEHLCRFVRMSHPPNKGLILKTHLSESEIKNNPRVGIVLNFVRKDKIIYPFEGSHEKREFNSAFYEDVNSSTYLNSILRRKFPEHEKLIIDLEGMWLSNNDNYKLYKKTTILHVHHKCYRAGVDMWDQDDQEYVTLCNVCHRITHDRQLIPYYDTSGRIYQYLTQCDRCSGKGYFKHYKHVQNGTCFKCNGMRLIPIDD